MMNFSTRDYFFSGLSIALGVINGYTVLNFSGDWLLSMSDLCMSNNNNNNVASSSTATLQPYLQSGVFDSLVCCTTQMFFDLSTQNPGGRMAIIGTFTTFFPVLILVGYEAGRPSAKGFVKYPMVFTLIAQLIGISLAFPLFWIPSYIASGGSRGSGGRGYLSTRHMYLSLVPPTVYLTFVLLVLFVPTTSFLWTISAGVLGGPIIVLTFAPLWLFSNDQETHHNNSNGNKWKQNNLQSAHSTLPYAACGIVCFFLWLWLLALVVIPQLGLSPIAIYQELWGDAIVMVKFLTMDGLVIWLSSILVIAYEKNSAALEVIGATCLFGPGTAISLVLAGLQVDDDDDLWDDTTATTKNKSTRIMSDKTKGVLRKNGA